MHTRILATYTHDYSEYLAAQTKMERSMLNITYKDRKTNAWVREKKKVRDIISNVRKLNSPGQGISTASKTADGPCVSPLVI